MTQLIMTACTGNAITANMVYPAIRHCEPANVDYIPADKVLIPVQTQKFSMDGLQALEALYQQIKVNINPKLNMIGVLPTMVDRTKVSKASLDALSEKYGSALFETSISKSVEAAKSSENGTPLCMTAHKLGKEYNDLATEVLSRC